MQKSNVIGIDLAKNVIQICVINGEGELVSNKAVSPKKLKEILAKSTRLAWCLVNSSLKTNKSFRA